MASDSSWGLAIAHIPIDAWRARHPHIAMQLVTVGGAIATKPVCLRKPRGAAAGAECIAVQQISVIVPMIGYETVLPRDRDAKNEENGRASCRERVCQYV